MDNWVGKVQSDLSMGVIRLFDDDGPRERTKKLRVPKDYSGAEIAQMHAFCIPTVQANIGPPIHKSIKCLSAFSISFLRRLAWRLQLNVR